MLADSSPTIIGSMAPSGLLRLSLVHNKLMLLSSFSRLRFPHPLELFSILRAAAA